jgi:mannose-6-phosphate isomerase-like protein (cupin superfamily)
MVLALLLTLLQTGAAPDPAPHPAIDTTKPATDVLASAIAATLKSAPSNAVSDQSIRVVDVGGYNVGIYVVNRPKATVQGAILHDNRISEIYYMLEGAGTLVTGGTLVEPQRLPADSRVVTEINGPSIRGSRIEGGTSRRIAKGDVVIIPGGTPHWWSALESDLAYLVVRPDPDDLLKTK